MTKWVVLDRDGDVVASFDRESDAKFYAAGLEEGCDMCGADDQTFTVEERAVTP